MRDKSQRTATKNESKYFVAVTKHRSNADMMANGIFKFNKLMKSEKKKKYKQIKYILCSIYLQFTVQ